MLHCNGADIKLTLALAGNANESGLEYVNTALERRPGKKLPGRKTGDTTMGGTGRSRASTNALCKSDKF